MKFDMKKTVEWTVGIGALNWGLSQLGFNVVDKILGGINNAPTIAYYVVGAAGAMYLYNKIMKK